MIIHLISSPRTISTSLMYAFDNRSDTTAIDEPFYAHYLTLTGKQHPGRKEVLNEMPAEIELVFEGIMKKAEESEHLFLKNMGHHMLGLPIERFQSYCNVFLIRNPGRIIQSITKILDSPTLLDIGVEQQWKCYNELFNLENKPIVIDSMEILRDPSRQLQKLCDAIGIPFKDEMLTWAAGPRPIDGSWAKYWYAGTHKSTGFGPYHNRPVELTPKGKKLLDEAMPLYKNLFEHSIHS